EGKPGWFQESSDDRRSRRRREPDSIVGRSVGAAREAATAQAKAVQVIGRENRTGKRRPNARHIGRLIGLVPRNIVVEQHGLHLGLLGKMADLMGVQVLYIEVRPKRLARLVRQTPWPP